MPVVNGRTCCKWRHYIVSEFRNLRIRDKSANAHIYVCILKLRNLRYLNCHNESSNRCVPTKNARNNSTLSSPNTHTVGPPMQAASALYHLNKIYQRLKYTKLSNQDAGCIRFYYSICFVSTDEASSIICNLCSTEPHYYSATERKLPVLFKIMSCCAWKKCQKKFETG